MPAADEKKALRKELMAKKLALTKNDVAKLSGLITGKLIKSIDWQNIQNIHIYLPIEKNNEIDTWPAVNFLQTNYPLANIYLPKGNGFVLFEPDDSLEPDKPGIPEPSKTEVAEGVQFDLIVLPTMGFDKRGFRLGYGGGYYDKLLDRVDYRQTIGLAYSFCEIDKMPEEPFDQKVETIITDKEIISVS